MERTPVSEPLAYDWDSQAVHLRAGAWTAAILPAYGANLVRLSYAGRDILRTPPTLAALAAAPRVYGLPLLFPSNRIEHGRFTFAGQTWQLPINEEGRDNHIHGLLNDAPFVIDSCAADRLACHYDNRGDRFPFPCRFELVFQLSAEGLRLDLDVVNSGELNLPVSLGVHTTFVQPAWFQVPVVRHWEIDSEHIPTGQLLELNAQESTYRDGCWLEHQDIAGFYTAGGQTAYLDDIAYSVSPEYDQWIVYNAGGQAGFLCLEPQVGRVNSLNVPGSFPVVPPGGRLQTWHRIYRRV